MSEERTIPTPARADIVTFTILVDGTALPREISLLGIHIIKEVNRIPYARVIVRDGDAAAEDFPVSNEDYFVPGNEIEIKLGYRSDEKTVFKGIIVRHNISVKRNRPPRLEIECKDKAFRTTLNRKNKYFHEMKDSDVFDEILGDYELEKDLEATSYTHPKLVQYNVTDWDFIVTRAEAAGQVVLADDGKITTKAPATSDDPVLSLTYGANILELEADMDAERQHAELRSFSWSPANQELSEGEAGDPGIDEPGNLSGEDLSEVGTSDAINYSHAGERPEEELIAWSESGMLRNRLSKIIGRVAFQGFADVRTGSVIEMNGLGERFNGKYYVASVVHEVSAGNWITNVQFGLSDKWFSESVKSAPPKASGLIPPVNGLHVGIATALQDDPDGEYRVKVKVPVIDSEDDGIWARIATLDAGDSRGTFFRPEIGDEVIVGFLNDDPRDAVILGMVHSSAKPAPLEPSDDNHEKGYVSRGEMKLIFNDEDNIITVETPNGNKVELSESEGGILIEDENGNKIEMTSSGIAMDSPGDLELKATGDVNIEGTNVNIKANANFKAEGSAGSEVSSSAIMTVKGSLVQIN